MSSTFMTAYILVWPVVVAGVLYVLASSFLRELAEARRAGRSVV